MNKTTVRLGFVTMAGAAALMSSCDTKLDISDIDSTVHISVDSLVIPLKIDKLNLGSVIEGTDRLEEINGEYVFTDKGTFESDNISIPGFTLASPAVEPSVISFNTVALPAGDITIELANQPSAFIFHTTGVSNDIISVSSLGAEFSVGINITFNGLQGNVNNATLQDLKLNLPRGLKLARQYEGTAYDAATGIMTISSVPVGADGKVSLNYDVIGLDCQQAGIRYNAVNGVIDYDGSFAVVSGMLKITAADIISKPESITMVSAYSISDINVTSFSGEMSYAINGFNVPEIELDDLPDFINQGGTNIWLENPQIYLSLNNPLQQWNIYGRLGMYISSHYGSNKAYGTYYLDQPSFEVGNPANASGKYTYCLSPSKPAAYAQGYADATHIGYKSLQRVLSGTGIPYTLRPAIYPATLPQQTVSDLPLGYDFGKIEGEYLLYAPMAMVENSAIVYRDTLDGWDSDDIKDLCITRLDVHMDITSNVPLQLQLTGYPINADGEKIGTEIECGDIEANASQQHLHILFNPGGIGVSGINGIVFRAQANAKGKPGVALSPDMTVVFENVKPSVSGYYISTL